MDAYEKAIADALNDVANIETEPKLDGRQMAMILANILSNYFS